MLKQMDLYEMISKWDTISQIKNYQNIKRKAEWIRIAGNKSLHSANQRIIVFMNEISAQTSLSYLKSIFEFFYK